MIPRDWQTCKLDRLVKKIGSGITPKGGREVYLDQGIPLIRSQNVLWGKLSLKDVAYISLEQHNKMKNTHLETNDVLLNITGASIGRSCIFPKIDTGANVNQHVCIIRTSEKLDTAFLNAYLNSQFGQNQILSLQAGGNRQGLNFEQIRNFNIPLPPLLEQCKIAEILGVWDESIDLLEKLSGKVRSRKQGLMQQLLTGKKRFKEFEGSEYSMVKLSEVAKIRRGASPRPIQDPKWFAEKGRGWVRIRDVTASNTYLMKTTQYLSDLAVEKSVKVDPGDLIMSICATIGVPRIVGIPACIHDGFVVFREFEQQIDKFFLYHYINLISAKISDSGQPGTQKNINTTIVGNIEVPKFSIPEQEKIAAVLSAADEEISTLEKQLAAYKQQKLGLMQQLLTGRIRI